MDEPIVHDENCHPGQDCCGSCLTEDELGFGLGPEYCCCLDGGHD